MKILLVENNISSDSALKKLLAAQDYAMDIANDGLTGLDLASKFEYDLILLELLIPKLDGIDLCRQLRSQGYAKPILLLTEKDTNADIVAALDAGADDYVTQPYDPVTLLARIRALWRRSQGNQLCSLSWGELCVDPYSSKVTFGEQVIFLTATEYNLLELFLRNPNRIFSRSAILDRLWGFDDAPTEQTVTTHIKELRKKLKSAGLTEDILETVYGMGYRLKPAPNTVASAAITNQDSSQKLLAKNMASVNRVLERFRNSFAKELAVLEQFEKTLLTGEFNWELHQKSKQEAHKLAGSMGSFGYPEGSKLARAAEHLLLNDRPFTQDEISHFSQLVVGLQQELTKPPSFADRDRLEPANQSHCVLVIDDDAMLTEQLQAEADSWGIHITVASNLAAARTCLALVTPDAIVLDLNFPQTKENGLILLRELAKRSLNIPVVVFTGRDSLADRLAVSWLGAKQFLHKPATTVQIFQAIARVLPQTKHSEAKVLILDDDPVILAQLSALLTPWGLKVTTLEEPARFWEMLNATSPDLIVLDLELPLLSGLDLCKIVRQDSCWGDLPILVVTAHTDAESLQKAFAAGADDFITKPVLGPELVTRVLSRIERMRSRGLGRRG